MNTEFNLTQTLLEKIKEKRPDIKVKEIDDSEVWYSHPDYAVSGPYRIKRLLMRDGMKIEAYVITTDTLLTLIPQLFGEVENPEKEYMLEVQEEFYEDSWNDTIFSSKSNTKDIILEIIKENRDEWDDPQEYYERIQSYGRFTLTEINSERNLKELDKALIAKYLVDGLWLKSREAVLEDLIYNVKKYL